MRREQGRVPTPTWSWCKTKRSQI